MAQPYYIPYSLANPENAIWVYTHNGEIRELSQASNLVAALADTPVLKDKRVYYPARKK